MGLFRPRGVKGELEQPSDVELVRRMRRGDESALEALYARYGGLVYTLALRIVGDPELAREVLQDAFLGCWRGQDTYDPQRGRVAWWLMGIARNRAVDLLRSRTHQARLREQAPLTDSLAASEPVNPGTPDARGLRRAILPALQALSEGQRQAIELAYYRGLTQAEIARELHAPLGTVKSRTREAMERLRQSLRPFMDPEGGVETP